VDIVYAAIEKLSPLLKTLITLYHNEDLSYTEIQQITKLPEGTIKSYLFRARKALKNDLLQHYKREEI
jgi:RNA polymerase sigma factor (sigma-70 family)